MFVLRFFHGVIYHVSLTAVFPINWKVGLKVCLDSGQIFLVRYFIGDAVCFMLYHYRNMPF